MHKIRVGIIGATGYTGSELVRILHRHDQAEISIITSESRAGDTFSNVHPGFRGIVDQKLYSIKDIENRELDVVFLGLPHGISMDFVRQYYDSTFRIIDLSGDFRLLSPESYKEWYGKDHVFPEALEKAVFGMPEIFRDKIRNATLVANPGCYPTSSILGVYPLLKEGIIDEEQIIIDSKSGTTGAGIKPKQVTHFSNVSDNFKAYGVKTHRHTIEIQEILNDSTDTVPLIQFTPHLLPIDRGILSTIYMNPVKDITEKDIQEIYSGYYTNEPFLRLREDPPSVKEVRGSNFCDLYSTYDKRTRRIIALTAIDNLVKGASGQAVHNMNLMFDLDETSGLNDIPLNP